MITNTIAKAAMTQRQFVDYMADMAGIRVEDAQKAYNIVIHAIKQAVAEGYLLKLYGFGQFYPQLHRGHQMQFTDGSKPMGDYLVLKFSASSSLNKRIRNKETLVISHKPKAERDAVKPQT